MSKGRHNVSLQILKNRHVLHLSKGKNLRKIGRKPVCSNEDPVQP